MVTPGEDRGQTQMMPAAGTREGRRQVCMDIGRFFFENAIPFNSILDVRQPLEAMFTSTQWLNSAWAKKPEGKEIRRHILSDKFWAIEWWIQFGDSTPELQSFAIRVLGLTCSSSGCERNWSTYSQVQTKRRNRLSTLRMNSLVYIMHNKRLRDRRLRNKGLKDDEDPLVCEDVASDNEWFIDETNLPLSDLQLEDLSVDVLRGYADQGGASTSATPHTSTSSAAKGKRKVGIIEDDEDLNFIDTIGEEDSLEDPFNEGQLSSAFASEMEKLAHVRYVTFDFHYHCAKGNFENLKILYDEISEDVQKQGYFLINAEGVILQEQSGVARANCIDCLDRTNVTQCYLARKSLNSQLQQMGAFSSSDCITLYADIDEAFKMLWAEHGDEISLEYTGTLALKGDLVRYGRQTIAGLIKDGITALSRYYLNNFQDGLRQDALDLISGRCDVNRSGPPSQLKDSLSYVPVASALIIGGLTVTSFSLNQGRHPQHFLSSVLLAGLAAGVMAAVKANGRQFCSRPRLCGLF
ncbi:hypothetical protein M5K25_018957 [Dendrobium thyrsiflorum]|uniref:SAC domain-containing protein n=1 Tax=Dendrobium thyrsiflorum TaxID=117978 RepID=A0ABD0UE59_DENTH